MANPITATVNYVKSSIAELKKVTWPTRQQTIRYSALVIAVSVVVAAFFASLDLGFSRGIMYAISKSPHSSAQPVEEPITPDIEPTPETTSTAPETEPVLPPPSTELPASDTIQLPTN